MQIIAPEILLEARELSWTVIGTGLFVGLMVWLTGWRWYRFWVVLSATAGAGLFGLLSSPYYQVQPLVAGLLLAVAAGVLALPLVRVVAFLSGGLAAWLVVMHAFSPSGWDFPLICFIGGGLAGLYLFRLWTMTTTSFAGTLLMGYSGLCLANRLGKGKLDIIALAENRATLLNWVCGGLVLIGVVAQVLLERYRAQKKQKKEEWTHHLAEEKLKQFYAKESNRSKRSWWFGGKRRRAG